MLAGSLPALLVAQFVLGIAARLAQVSSTLAGTRGPVATRSEGTASALLTATRQCGSALGVAIVSAALVSVHGTTSHRTVVAVFIAAAPSPDRAPPLRPHHRRLRLPAPRSPRVPASPARVLPPAPPHSRHRARVAAAAASSVPPSRRGIPVVPPARRCHQPRSGPPDALERRLVGVVAAAVGRPRVGILTRAALAAGRPAAAGTPPGPPWPPPFPLDRATLLTLAEAFRSEGPTSSTSTSYTVRFSPSLVSYDRCRSRPDTITRIPRVSDSATFSAACRHTLQVRNSESPSFHSLVSLVPESRRGRHAEPRDRLPGRGEPQLRVIHEIARDRDLRCRLLP